MSMVVLNNVERIFFVSRSFIVLLEFFFSNILFLFVCPCEIDDLFRHGFDGSGGDNYFDAGSCIDGRLTSAWNCK